MWFEVFRQRTNSIEKRAIRRLSLIALNLILLPKCCHFGLQNSRMPCKEGVYRDCGVIPTPKCKTDFNCFCLEILTWLTLIWYSLSQFYEVFLLLLSNSYHLDAIKNSVNKYLLHSIRFQLSQYAINRFHNRLQKSSW